MRAMSARCCLEVGEVGAGSGGVGEAGGEGPAAFGVPLGTGGGLTGVDEREAGSEPVGEDIHVGGALDQGCDGADVGAEAAGEDDLGTVGGGAALAVGGEAVEVGGVAPGGDGAGGGGGGDGGLDGGGHGVLSGVGGPGRSAGAGWLPGCRDPVPDRAVVGLPGDALGLGRLDRLNVGGRRLTVGGVGAVGVGPVPTGVGAVAEDPPAANLRVCDLAGHVAGLVVDAFAAGSVAVAGLVEVSAFGEGLGHDLGDGGCLRFAHGPSIDICVDERLPVGARSPGNTPLHRVDIHLPAIAWGHEPRAAHSR